MPCSTCRHSSASCICNRCPDCGRKGRECRCPRGTELAPRPSRRVAESSLPPRSSVPANIRVGSSSGRASGSSSLAPPPPRASGSLSPRLSSSSGRPSASSLAPPPPRSSGSSSSGPRMSSSSGSASASSYGNVAYMDRLDPMYGNTGPPYDSTTNVLSPRHRKIVDDTRGSGNEDLSERFERQARLSNKHSGNHSDQPTYQRESLYRTGSDMEDYDSYKRRGAELDRAKAPYASASQAAPRMQKTTDPENHIRVADIHGRIGDAHRGIAGGRLSYMEDHPGGLADPGSFRTHVTAAGDGLVGMNSAYDNRDRERDTARGKQLAQQSGAWNENPRAGGPYLDRPGSGSTMHSSGSSKVSSGRSSGRSSKSGGPPPFSSGGTVLGRCADVDSRGRQCTRMTSHKYCRDHS